MDFRPGRSPVRFCLVPLRLARPREGRPYDHHSIDVSIKPTFSNQFVEPWLISEHLLFLPFCVSPLFRLCSVSGASDCRLFLLLSITGHVSLFPLLFTAFENVIKVVLVTGYSLASYAFLSTLLSDPKTKRSRVTFSRLERLYLLGLALVAAYECCLHWLTGLNQRLPFLPLLIMSVYCALGIVYVWILWMMETLQSAGSSKNTKQH